MNEKQLEVLKIGITKLSLTPNDILVLKVPSELTEYELDLFAKKLSYELPDVKFIILNKAIDLEIIEQNGDKWWIET